MNIYILFDELFSPSFYTVTFFPHYNNRYKLSLNKRQNLDIVLFFLLKKNIKSLIVKYLCFIFIQNCESFNKKIYKTSLNFFCFFKKKAKNGPFFQKKDKHLRVCLRFHSNYDSSRGEHLLVTLDLDQRPC